MKAQEKQTSPVRTPLPVCNPDPEVGLTQEQAQRRLDAGWGNAAPEGAGRSERDIIFHNCVTFFNLVFLVLAAILILAGSSVKNMTFLVIVVVNTVIACFQEIRAKRAVDKLTLVAAQTLPVYRDGEKIALPTTELVRDDIVEFSPGNQICADAILRVGELQVDESLVTGEADAIGKGPGDALRSGSFVIAGRGRAQLTQVGPDAFAAKLAREAKADPKAAKSEMMRSLDHLIRAVGFLLIPVGLAMFYKEFFLLHSELRTSVESTVAALIGMIPEGLYLLTSVAMAVSAVKLTRKRVLVQDMNCIETLARVDVLCVDKTGTITEPAMDVENILPLTPDAYDETEAALTALYGSREPDNDTARALAELFDGTSDWECQRYIPFTSSAKWSGGVFKDRGAYLTGAPEYLIREGFPEVRAQAQDWAESGYRVLLVARYDGDPQPGALEEEKLTPLALVLLTNRIRPQAQDTFRYFAAQGVSIRVISGDNPATVSQIAGRAGIENADKLVDVTGLESDEDFRKAAEEYTVFGRVTPEKKKKLIRAFKAAKHTVAMTGDGVNDVLAMKEADCGIAMASGAQAASQVARLVLLDSDFAAMPGIVGEGRRVINNIQRAATLFLVKNIFSLGLALCSLLTLWPYTLAPVHLSAISTLTIGIPSFFLAMEPNYERVRGRFLAGVLRRAFPGGLTNIFVALMAQGYMQVFSLPQDETSTVCAAILGVVGLLVLYQTCKPFNLFRKIIWAAMAAGLVACFTLFWGILELQTGSVGSRLIMFTLLLMTPTVFFAIQRIFDWGDKIIAWARRAIPDLIEALKSSATPQEP